MPVFLDRRGARSRAGGTVRGRRNCNDSCDEIGQQIACARQQVG